VFAISIAFTFFGGALVLTIRRVQLDALEKGTRLRFGRDVIAALAEDVPSALLGLSQADVAYRFEVSLACADRYNILVARDLRAFLRMCFLIAPDFSDHLPFSEMMRKHKGVLQALFDDIPISAWQAAMIDSIVRRYRQGNGDVPRRTPAVRASSVQLVPLSRDHEQAWWHHRLHPDIWRLADALPLSTVDEARKHLHELVTARCDHFAIVGADGDFIGALLLSPCSGGATLSYWIRRDFWGMGFASQVLHILMQTVCREGKYARLDATVHPSNTPSACVLRKAGFERRASDTVLRFERLLHST
jgi:RimJ/RimL family protein N-acetyltransferase